ncbi:CshA/CshB family fibrillar adhesin-related protein [Demequina mangrovi]|uniref:Conserved repeat domain-containing protein n=1 Tax=Demequina mangrovi TaxID=1043493 RepID=A0A1H6U444_9MICO|nr:CshA/CshB family fibrillar adhesin-related protein [Demequina mangrovi]SEI83170.1 conserved repeat domain-containing protein [Demequina mangrovi]
MNGAVKGSVRPLRTPQRMATALGTILALVATTFVVIVGGAPTAEARYAEGGDGLYPGYIDWFEWGSDGENIPNGTERTNTRNVGLQELTTTCTITGLNGQVEAYRPGNYRGDALDNLYNIGGIDGANELVSGVANTISAATVSFDFDCEVTLDGTRVDVMGLVVADAESNNSRQGEYVEATPVENDAVWRVVDRMRACDTSTIATLTGDTLRLESDGTQCSEVNNTYGPIAVGFMEGATGAHVEMHGGGVSAVALGVVFEADFGDAPLSYGSAGSLLQSTWSGGTVGQGATNVSDDSFVMGTPGGYEPILGSTVDSDAVYIGSQGADFDDTTGNPANDEDGISPPGVLDTDYGETYSLDVACVGTGWVSGWVDWNFNGTFDDSERAGAVQCAGGTVNLTWTVPDDAVQTVVDPTYMRLRVAAGQSGSENPNNITSRGEVEDYPIYVDLPDPGLTITKDAEPPDSALPGDTVDYTITVTNTGEVDYNDENGLASITDDLSAVLDDAVYNNDEAASTGTPTYSEPVLSWEGALAVGESATITYSVTVNDPVSGDGLLSNTVVGPEESNCADGSEDPDCTVELPIRALEILKTVDPSDEAAPGDTVTYTVTVTNPGPAAYTADAPASFDDDLSGVLDDATYNDDESASTGTASFSDPTLHWEGALAAGESATITYSVTVNSPLSGDGLLDNSVVGPPESNCDDGTEEGCTTEVPIRAVEIVKTSDGADGVLPGDTVTYEITVTNNGQVDYTVDDPAYFDDDLSDVLDDGVYGGGSATSGDLTFTDPTLHWEGALAVGETVTITYTITVDDPVTGDGNLYNVVVGPPESNCTDPAETQDADCIEPDPIRSLEITKTSDPTDEVQPGDTVTYTVTVENTGQFNYTELDPAAFEDDLSDVLDDATYNDDATASAGDVSFSDPTLSWSGPLDAGDTVTITYSVTVDDPPGGDGLLVNAVVGPPESNCDDGTEEGCTTEVPIRSLEITKTVDPSGAVRPSDTVTYTVTVENTGETDYTVDDPASFDDDLSAVLDDATYNDDALASSGDVSFSDPTLHWEGALAAGETVTVTYSVTVDDPPEGDGLLVNAVVGPPESNCDDGTEEGCTTEVPVRSLEILKTATPSDGVLPGDTVDYTVTLTNTGQVDYLLAYFEDDLSDVLDDATYNDDLASTSGITSYVEPEIRWYGPIAIGGTVTITYSVTVDDPPEGDGFLTNAVVGPLESNCEAGSTDPDCTTTVPVGSLEIVKTASPDGEVLPGDTVTYTVSVTNTGQIDYTAENPASFDDDLSAVLDDATYNNDESATSGTPTYSEPTLSWEGALAAGDTVTVTYSVTVNDPLTGDGLLDNAVVGPPESNCDDGAADEGAEGCTTEVPVKALEIEKTADPSGEVLPGDTVTYTVTVENIGQADYTAEAPASFTDDLTEVLDDATYNDDETASSGDVSYAEPTLSWEGALAVGETVTITYSVTVDDPPDGDGLLTNAVVGPPESNCDDGTEEGCTTEVPVKALEIVKSSDGDGSTLPGDVVTYTITVTNTGEVDYTADDPASLEDDLSGILDDAVFNDDEAATSGTVDFTDPTLSWEGPLAAGETVTITYSVTVNDPLSGDGEMFNVVVGPPESNCDTADTTDPDCVEPNPIQALEIEKSADPDGEVLPGGTVTYTVTVTNTGQTDYTAENPASFDDDLTDVLDDATYNDDATAAIGTASYTEPILSWEGPLAVGESITVTYSVTVDDPPTGDGLLVNAVVGPPESNCDDGAADEGADPCTTEVPVKALEIEKVADPADEVLAGDTVTYTVTVTNSGEADYTAEDPASFDDDLTEVLDDATYNDDESATSGDVTFSDPTLHWEGALAAGETVTVTYSVTVTEPLTGDGLLTNAVVGPPESNCDDGTEEGCTTEVPVKALELAKFSDAVGRAQPGDVVTYTITITNTGQADYTAEDPASFTDDISDVLDDAVYNGDESASSGTPSYAEPTLSWEGPLAVGESATITYSVTVNDPLSGDGLMTNAVVGPPESNCDAEDAGPECEVTVPLAALEIEKTADPDDEVLPGETVTYTVTVANTGQVDYLDVSFSDDLTEVLDDAVYNDDESATAGTPTYSEPTLSWTGPVDAGETVTITYSVTVNDPLTGDGLLDNAVVGPPESNCEDGTEDGCTTEVPVKALLIEKTAEPADEVLPGGTVTYTVTVENIGQADYTDDAPASFTDDLTAVLDDAVYNGDESATSGTPSYAEPVLSWEGALVAGETVTITYSVTVNDPLTGDGLLDNAVVGPPESNCDDGTEEGCTTEVPVKALLIEKTAEPADEVLPGGTVTYTVTVENIGEADYTADAPASFEDDLSAVLDDATYNNDESATSGTPTYSEPTLSWEGALAAGETVTITYSVTVNDPTTGDGLLDNAVVGPPESNCDDGTEEGCTTEVPVRELELVKTSDSGGEVLPGDVVTYTVTVTNTGQVDYTEDAPATFDDDLSELLDDATYNGDESATGGTPSYAEPLLSWEGPLAVGESVTVTYSVTINEPLSGDGELFNVVVGPPESNCDSVDTTDPDCVEPNPIRALEITKQAAPGDEVLPGNVVTYTITVTNTGVLDYTDEDPATLDDDLTEVLDDATYNDDESATGGTASYSEPTLHWEGPLGAGESVTITYSVTVNDPLTGDGLLDNAVVGPPESNCDDGTEEGCTTEVPVRAVEILKTSDPSDEVLPGDVVTYTVTITNTGQVDYGADPSAYLDDDLSDVLDDATYNGDGAATSGSVDFSDTLLSWTGGLAVGETVTITYSVTVNDPPTGDGLLDNAVVGPPESNCDDGTEEGCTTEVPVRTLELVKSSDGVGSALPGDVVTYSITVTNTGQVDYTAEEPAQITDDLTDVLDDATYNDDESATSGTPTYSEPTLSWEGPLAVGESVTITYSVTVNDPLTGDGIMDNTVLGPPESNCDAEDAGPECEVTLPIQALEILKTADPDDEVLPGETVTYTVTLTNIGQVDYLGASFTDDLTEVLDDAVYNDDESATSGTPTYSEPTLSWSGSIAAGDTVTVTYSVTVNDPMSGDGLLDNAVVGPPGSACEDGTEEGCTTEVPVKALEILKVADPADEVVAGDTVTYTVTVENIGQADYTDDAPASFEDDLTAVIDDAVYNDDESATSGTASYAEPVLSWEGALAVGETVTVTYSVTVNNPPTSDGLLDNAVVGPPESNCDEGTEEGCTTEVPVKALLIEKEVDPADEVLPGEVVTYTVTVENIGHADYTAEAPASFEDDLTEVLDDAVYNDDESATSGTASYAEPVLSWEGALAVGETVTVTYSVTVNDPMSGDGLLDNAVLGPDGSNCEDGSTDESCTTEVPVKALLVEKEVDPADEVLPGGTVTYTVTVENIGQADYTEDAPASFEDDLTEVLDDAVYNADESATSGTPSYAEPVLSWEGALAAGESATITYSVTVNDPMSGDGLLDNAVVGPPESNCDEGTEEGCTTEVPIRALEILKTADPDDEVLPGGTVEYTITLENIGQVDYTRATFTDDLSDILDDATANGDFAATAGGFTYANPNLTWVGPIAVGDTVTITYSVTVNDPLTGDGFLTNAVVGPPESNCDEGTEEGCTTEVPVKALEIEKTSDRGVRVQPGDPIVYTITVTNIGQVPYTEEDPAELTDDLTAVIDDATYNDDESADIGSVSYAEPTLSWSGSLEPGETATITYSVTVNEPVTGDGEIDNVVVGPEESNCTDPESTDADCIEHHTLRAMEIVKTAEPEGSVTVGDTVTYTIEVTNVGSVPYTFLFPARIDDDLSEILDDATYNDDAAADTGTVSYAEPTLTWTGSLGVGATATITYSVTVDDPPEGDASLDNAVLGPPESNCFVATPRDDGEVQLPDECHVETPIRLLEIEKVADVDEVIPGDVVTYTVTVTSTGTGDYTDEDPASMSDDLTGVLDDATYNDDAAADVGDVSFADPVLSWSGPLAAGESATITYSVTVDTPPTGDITLANAVLGPPESNCPSVLPVSGGGMAVGVATAIPEMPEGCQVITPIRMFEVEKFADAVEADPGDVVTYVVTVTSTGTAAYTDENPASFEDDLSEVLDDATYNDDATATAGDVTVSAPTLSWTGPLEVGGVVTVEYSVTVDDPMSGDGTMVNVITPGEGIGGECSSDEACSTETVIVAPEEPGTGGVLGSTGPERAALWTWAAALLLGMGAVLYGTGAVRRRKDGAR